MSDVIVMINQNVCRFCFFYSVFTVHQGLPTVDTRSVCVGDEMRTSGVLFSPAAKYRAGCMPDVLCACGGGVFCQHGTSGATECVKDLLCPETSTLPLCAFRAFRPMLFFVRPRTHPASSDLHLRLQRLHRNCHRSQSCCRHLQAAPRRLCLLRG